MLAGAKFDVSAAKALLHSVGERLDASQLQAVVARVVSSFDRSRIEEILHSVYGRASARVAQLAAMAAERRILFFFQQTSRSMPAANAEGRVPMWRKLVIGMGWMFRLKAYGGAVCRRTMSMDAWVTASRKKKTVLFARSSMTQC